MAEPQPAEIHEGASTPPAPTGSAEDRKAAAALSNLDASTEESSDKRPINAEALGQAIKNLEGSAGTNKTQEKKTAEKETKHVKVNAADVTLVVEHTELSKIKATELLKANDGDAVKALTAFVTAHA